MRADYLARIDAVMCELGIPMHIVVDRGLPLFPEAEVLVETSSVGKDGRPFLLEPSTASAWQAMCQAANRNEIKLVVLSAFRSLDYQADIIRRKLQQGRSLEEILSVSAIPGYSEHHSGKALDIVSPECLSLDAAFEHTPAFQWLTQHASTYGFFMSYPRNNRYGYIYEPWHWCFHSKGSGS
ncbi:M15 family metallopeptidase [Methylobacillus caricis]|uniref:M15 family metallopeptidase n=1 Tax=Methylobacillus caricis TaxID=1971611 RepID=UPI001CFFAF3F|nr:M15 family metallopeptidase [Methylobacillus caricis]MCB5188982.1 M15 family metallopeptidase [Methylobacillus caricis]